MKRLGAALLTAAMCLGLLTGCGDNSGNSGGTTTQNKVNKAWQDKILYLSEDGEWKWNDIAAGNETVLLDSSYTTDYDMQALPSSYTPPTKDFSAVWYAEDGKSLYFLGAVRRENRIELADLFLMNMEDMSVQPVATVMSMSVQPTKKGLAYLVISAEGEQELHACIGAEDYKLATEVYDFDVTGDGSGIFFSRQNENLFNLGYVPSNGDAPAISVAEGANKYYYAETESFVCYAVWDIESALSGALTPCTVYCADSEGEKTVLAENCYGIGNVFHDDSFYYAYADLEKEIFEFCRADGEKTETLDDQGWGLIVTQTQLEMIEGVIRGISDAKEKTIICSDGRFYLDEEYSGSIQSPGEAFYVGRLNESKESFIYSLRERTLYAFDYEGGEEQELRVLSENCFSPVLLEEQGVIYYLTGNGKGEVFEQSLNVVRYQAGKQETLMEDVWIGTIRYYADGTVMGTDKDKTLFMYQNGELSTVAENVSYYLRTADKDIFYLTDGTLFKLSGESQTRVADGVLRFYNAEADFYAAPSSKEYEYMDWLF